MNNMMSNVNNNNNMNLMGMNNMNMIGMYNNMNNMNMMGMNNSMNNMNMMGMNNINMGMGNINMGSMNNILDNDDKEGWKLTFKYNDGKDVKEVDIHISSEKSVQEAINRFKLEIANDEDMKFEYPPNKELNRALKINQSGLSKNSIILVKSKKEDDFMTEEEEENWAKANRGRRNAFYMKKKFKGDKPLRNNNNIN